jgi:hypothetical protein
LIFRPRSLSPAELAEEVYEASEELLSSISSDQPLPGGQLEAVQVISHYCPLSVVSRLYQEDSWRLFR